MHHEEEEWTQNWMLRTDSNHIPPNISTVPPYLLRYILITLVKNPSSDGMLPDNSLSSNINASRRRGKYAKLDVENRFKPCSSKHKSTLPPYLLRYVHLTFVNNPSSDGMLPDNWLLSNINASWRRGKNAKLDVEDGFKLCSSKHIYSTTILTQIYLLNIS